MLCTSHTEQTKHPGDASRPARVRAGGAGASRQNENYFTEIGGKNALKREGTVDSANWMAALGPLGEPVEDLRRTD